VKTTHHWDNLPTTIQRVLEKVIEVCDPEKIILFGSRARGDHRTNSDFDIAIRGIKCNDQAWTRLLVELEEEPGSLYQIDLVQFEELAKDYKLNISAEGKILYG